MLRKSRTINIELFVQYIRSIQMHRLLNGDWISIHDAAERLNYSSSYIVKMIQKNKLDGVYIPSIGYAVNKASVDFYQRLHHDQTP
jgi:excisionase family DNA binding protein